MTNPQDIDKADAADLLRIAASLERSAIWLLHGIRGGAKSAPHASALDMLDAAAALRAVQEPVAPIGWLVRGGGESLTPVGDGYNEWQYRHGPDEPYLAWTHQEKMPVYATPPPPGAASPAGPLSNQLSGNSGLLIAAPQPPPLPAGWMPIESAPRHIEVLVWREDSGPFIAQLTTPDAVISPEVIERENLKFPDDFEEWFSIAFGWQEGSERPTHWMPLPAGPGESEASCTWQEDDEAWRTSCGHAFNLEAGTPAKNGMKWCCYCGRSLAQGAPNE